MKDVVRFTRSFIETLTVDEEAILYYVYFQRTKRIIQFESVKVVPVFEMLLSTDGLTEEGMQVLSSCFLKIANEYSLPTWGFDKAPNDASPLFVTSTMSCISGVCDTSINNLEAPTTVA